MQQLPEHAECVFDGERCQVYHWQQEMYDGSMATFEKIIRRPAVTIFAVQDKKLVIQEQEQPYRPLFSSIPGGVIDEGEDNLTAAKRELLEETGLASDDWEKWQVLGQRGYVHWENHVYIARQCKKIQEPNLDNGEKIQNNLIEFDDFLQRIDNERFRHKDLMVPLLRMRLDIGQKEQFCRLLGL